jgi:hypothetical protein
MWRGRRLLEAPSPSQAETPERIGAGHRVADVLDWFPRTEPVFLRHGFAALKSPMLRRTLARQVTLSQAAALRQVNLETLLNDLNASIRSARIELPVLTSLNDGRPAGRGSE